MWQMNARGHEAYACVRNEYATQCERYAEEIKTVSEANSSQAVRRIELQATRGIRDEVVSEKLHTALLGDELVELRAEFKAELGGRDNHIIHMQHTEAMQAARLAPSARFATDEMPSCQWWCYRRGGDCAGGMSRWL